MKLSDFDYELPEHLIAQHPPANRAGGRLLVVGDELSDRKVTDLPDELRAGDLLIFNNTRVFPARLFGRKHSGGRVEMLVERILDGGEVLAFLRASKSPRAGTLIDFDGGETAEVVGREDDLFRLRFRPECDVLDVLNGNGHVPLPPYIRRDDSQDDRERYQTVYASQPGAVAAPTAGLHFDEHLLNALRGRGVEFGYVTLHVGAGTFRPVRTDNLDEHRMHAEHARVDAQLCRQVAEVRARGGRVIAVGTTVVRSLEAASQSGELQPFSGETRLFIRPGYVFHGIDGLMTNFHLPQSTLLMLVSAFAGSARIRQAYAHAVASEYRFFSYGDAMLLWPRRRSDRSCGPLLPFNHCSRAR